MKNIIILAFLFTGLTSYAQVNYQNNTLKVTGSSIMKVTPDEIYLNVVLQEVNTRDKKVNMSQASNEFYKVCNELKIPTENINVGDMQFDAIKMRMKFLGKKERSIAKKERYEIKFSNLADIEKFVLALDKDFVQSIDLGQVTHSKITTFREQVKIDAIKAAKRKGEYLTEAIGQICTRAIHIEEINASNSRTIYNNSNWMSNRRLRGGAIDPTYNNKSSMKPIELRYEVLVIFELK